VTVRNPYVVKMSGKEHNTTLNKIYNTTTFHFYQDIKIPSYLLAIAVGNLAVQHIGDEYSRSSVIAEPGADYLDRYANELSELDDLLNATEAWLTPYIWSNYTILILPPSFPFGGMENPLLTFASPTIIVGDKS
jgi:leukotriene-A4 hydrolase